MADYNLEHLKVLIVDDNRHMRALVRSILYALGMRHVEDASDGSEAFKKLQNFAADIVICDWNMEPLNGLDFIRLIRTSADTPNPYLPVIMLTGYTDANHVFEARDCGVHEFLAKPVSAEQLYARIKAVIERERVFVKAGSYFGPDKRRRDDPKYTGIERRKGKKKESSDSDDDVLSAEDTDALLNG